MQRTNATTILLVFVALLFGLLGVYAFRKLTTPAARERAAAQKLTVPMASRHLPAGRTITMSDVALVRLTRDQMKSRSIKGMFMSDPEQIIGSTIMTAIERGKTFHTDELYPEGFRPNVTDSLKPGQRAVTIMISSEDALSGYASAGQFVDILFRAGGEGNPNSPPVNYETTWHPKYGYHAKPGSNGGGGWSYTRDDRAATQNQRNGVAMGTAFDSSKTITLMQGVKILALENNSVQENAQDVPADQAIRLTVAVTPEQASTLRVVEGHGKLSLSLRNPNDDGIVDPAARSLKDILGISDPPIQRGPDVMEVYRGSSVSRLSFDGSHPLAVRMQLPESQKDAYDRSPETGTKSISIIEEDVFQKEGFTSPKR